MNPAVRQLKVWKAAHKLGRIEIKPSEILPPLEIFRARDFSHSHCEILKRKLMSTGSGNAKGVKLAIYNAAIEQEWLAADPETQRLMFSPGHDFYKRAMAQKKYALGGDHTRSAVTDLNKAYPAVLKWQKFERVTLIVGGDSLASSSTLRDLGVLYNSKQYHKEMGYADRILLIRKFYTENDMLKKGGRRDTETKEWCDKQCALAQIPPNSWSQYAAPARVDAASWTYMEAIMKGQYAKAIGRGTLPGTIPTTQSPFNQMMTCPADCIFIHLQQVYNGTLAISGLNISAANYKAYQLAKQMIMWTVEHNSQQGATEEIIEDTWPFLLSRSFIVTFVAPIKELMKKQKKVGKGDCPSYIKDKVLAHIRAMKSVGHSFFQG
jgi:hypothetical protein